ncbi:TetR/AcrR family transcriptional regulator [Gracilibacillus lacisalsi]|uniref:TetR/AcrR family transcriptional regulator n=1 Tax=Gracilibacillus lacisalsi TaxID=393087 RepID=UPI00035DC1D6|nr:TetR/AcrR family transcriptional regulator [Gracilibacillus lacisalsi]
MDTKQHIMNTALILFSDHGFNETSVQQIAQKAGISKGGFYNYFSSKRDLMLEMIDEHHSKIINSTHQIDETNHNLAAYIQHEMTAWMEHQPFIHVMLNEFQPKKDPQINKKMDELHVTLTQKHKEIFYLCYGDKIKPFLTDMVVILEGMLKEYLLYMFIQQTQFDVQQLSNWICHHIDSIVNNLHDMDPFLHETQNETFESVLKDLKAAIKQKKLPNQDKLLEVVKKIEQEIDNHSPYSITAEVSLHYLKGEETIHTNVLRLEPLCKQGGN